MDKKLLKYLVSQIKQVNEQLEQSPDQQTYLEGLATAYADVLGFLLACSKEKGK